MYKYRKLYACVTMAILLGFAVVRVHFSCCTQLLPKQTMGCCADAKTQDCCDDQLKTVQYDKDYLKTHVFEMSPKFLVEVVTFIKFPFLVLDFDQYVPVLRRIDTGPPGLIYKRICTFRI